MGAEVAEVVVAADFFAVAFWVVLVFAGDFLAAIFLAGAFFGGAFLTVFFAAAAFFAGGSSTLDFFTTLRAAAPARLTKDFLVADAMAVTPIG